MAQADWLGPKVGRCSAFITWTKKTLAIAVPRLQHHKNCLCYYDYNSTLTQCHADTTVKVLQLNDHVRQWRSCKDWDKRWCSRRYGSCQVTEYKSTDPSRSADQSSHAHAPGTECWTTAHHPELRTPQRIHHAINNDTLLLASIFPKDYAFKYPATKILLHADRPNSQDGIRSKSTNSSLMRIA